MKLIKYRFDCRSLSVDERGRIYEMLNANAFVGPDPKEIKTGVFEALFYESFNISFLKIPSDVIVSEL